jgi:hypothetical protein
MDGYLSLSSQFELSLFFSIENKKELITFALADVRSWRIG